MYETEAHGKHNLFFNIYLYNKIGFLLGKTQVQFLSSNTLDSLLNLNIIGKDNIVCISYFNATMCLNLIGEPNVPNLKNCT